MCHLASVRLAASKPIEQLGVCIRSTRIARCVAM